MSSDGVHAVTTNTANNTNKTSILPASHSIPTSEHLMLTESSTGYAAPLVRYTAQQQQFLDKETLQMTLHSKSANYNLRTDKVILKHNTSVPDSWMYAPDPYPGNSGKNGTPSPFHTYSPMSGFSSVGSSNSGMHPRGQGQGGQGKDSGVFQYAVNQRGDQPSGSLRRYVPMSPLITTEDTHNAEYAPTSTYAQHSTAQSRPPQDSLQNLSDAQLLARYQALTNAVNTSSNQNQGGAFKIQPVKTREVLGRLMDSAGRVSDDALQSVGLERSHTSKSKRSKQRSSLLQTINRKIPPSTSGSVFDGAKFSTLSTSSKISQLNTPLSVFGGSVSSVAQHKRSVSGGSVTQGSASHKHSSDTYGRRKTIKDLTPTGQALALKMQQKMGVL
eukprot:gene23902-30180_t